MVLGKRVHGKVCMEDEHQFCSMVYYGGLLCELITYWTFNFTNKHEEIIQT